MDEQDQGAWKDFSSGIVTDGKSGVATIRLNTSPVETRYVRVLMTRSSNTCDTHGSSDRRNCVGYAIRELYLGTIGEDGSFKELLLHSPAPNQTFTLFAS